jgi:hypothetical protein
MWWYKVKNNYILVVDFLNTQCVDCVYCMDKESTRVMENKRKRVNISLDPQVYQEGLVLAAEDRRDFSHFLEVLIEKHAQRKREKQMEQAAPGNA